MRAAVIALTENGSSLALKLGVALKADVFIKEDFIHLDDIEQQAVFPINTSLVLLVEEIFHTYRSLIFIMACGIVVRTIAPFIKAKTSDPAVIVMDEKGQYVISLLSGHIGGANKMAAEIAEITGGVPVITTSTDVNGVISFDVFADQNNCRIENLSDLKFISSQLVNGGIVAFYSDCKITGKVPQNLKPVYNLNKNMVYKNLVVLSNRTDLPVSAGKILYIRPRNLVIGVGCKRGTSKELIRDAILDFMKLNNKRITSIRCLATVDLKKDEEGLLRYCKEMSLELKIISREEIGRIEENHTCSEFVKSKIGVASVAEPCSVLGSKKGRLICKKTCYKELTLALSEEDIEYCL